MAKTGTSTVPTALIHPIYLDVPMMVSFLAAMQGGVSYENEVTERALAGKEREGEGSGAAKIPGIAGLFGFGFDLSGRMKQRTTGEETTESKVVRKHTEASLFNLLRHSLDEQSDLRTVENPADLATLKPYEIFEIRGEIVGNPLERLIDIITAFAGFLGIDLEEEASIAGVDGTAADPDAPERGGQRQPNPPVPAELQQMRLQFINEYLMIFRSMKRDVEKSRVIDLLLRTHNNVQAVVTLTREFLPQQTEELLLGSQVTVLGKAATVLSNAGSINLARRSIFGMLGITGAQGMLSTLQASQGGTLDLGETNLIIESPAVQIIPLSVFL